ncbi:septal ring lytic transglycosylase RlpA family protein [Variovorax sp. PAMC 28711]|uniref:septal ring lytic transglycosylase RlpA family protein n=1 Tax=Variovorax sp. PAMC 28711 TaxID=1795631 RepID=UPI000ABC7289|nr:septal ring lytic transglycosylase RlpA family protein [Variovorax sp. PAMC 28711]
MKGLRAALVSGLCCALAACTTPPAPVDGAAPDAADKVSIARLSPLARGLAVPAGAAPRSLVPGVNYDLSVPGTGSDDLPPDDGVPGDGASRDVFERGGASWYGIQFHQKKTANGERFDMGAFTAAHKTLPFNTRVCVRSLVNGKEVLVRINDRGPYAQGRVIDLSRAAADQIGLIAMGIKQVALSVIDRKDQRCGGAVANLDAAPMAAEPASAPKRSARQAAPKRRR